MQQPALAPAPHPHGLHQHDQKPAQSQVQPAQAVPVSRPPYSSLVEYCTLIMVDGVSRRDGRLSRLDERWISLCRAALRFPWTPANSVASAAGPR